MVDWEITHIDESRKFVQENGVSGIEEFFKKKLGKWKDIEVNIGVTGNTGTGKSSFINAIRRLPDDDEMAAQTGVEETTTKPACYAHPTNSKIRFWDLPGIGTPNYSDLGTYCREVQLENYDTFLIFTSSRFTGNDLQLARKIRSINKKFFFIRTKIDEDYRAEKRKRSFEEEAMLKEIRDYSSENLGSLLERKEEVFLISNHYPEKWDFARLTQAILDVLPIRQRECLTLSLGVLTSMSRDILKRKVEVLKGRIWMVASASAIAALVPIPGLSFSVDLLLITSEISFYHSQLGLPEQGTLEFARLNSGNQERIRKLCLTTAHQVARIMKSCSTSTVVEEFSRYVPVIGLGLASALSFRTTYHFLNRCLEELEKTAISVLDHIAKSCVADLDLD